jgi:hypothetical protein
MFGLHSDASRARGVGPGTRVLFGPMRIPPASINAATLASAYRIGPVNASAGSGAGATRLPVTRVDASPEIGRETARAPASGGAFRMYTRAADVNEIATAVTLGRSLDVRG